MKIRNDTRAGLMALSLSLLLLPLEIGRAHV